MNLILVDGSWMAHRARHGFASGDRFLNDPNLALHGVLQNLRDVCLDSRIRSTNMHVFFDTRHSKRKEIDPSYKRKRAESCEADRTESDLIHELMDAMATRHFPRIGIPTYAHSGYEADDLMAVVASARSARGQKVTIVTADSDLWQCIDRNVDWYNPMTGKAFTYSSWMESMAIEPKQWADVKAIAGCTSDSVPGIKGVGEVTALRFVRDELPTKSVYYQRIMGEEGQQIIKHTRRLTTLPLDGTPKIPLQTVTEWDRDGFDGVCKLFAWDRLHSRKTAWNELFDGSLRHHAARRTRKRGQNV